MNEPIAIVGLSCVYPDARTPMELWENVLAQRRAFRRIPDERLRSDDYFSADPHSPDRTYAAEAAVIEGYEFDRVAFKVVGSTYRAADLAHWLALDVASRALDDAGFKNADGLPREMTGVILGNTLTGEFSRANLMRLRWPYVRRVVEDGLTRQGWTAEQRREFLERLETQYKSPFPPVGEETLAGGLSNTIAGRICNQFDLKGGGYTVDGACASSLLAVANACSSLAAGDLDIALAGGVDLSLDPFEIVGFAKTGALAPELMRIYDTRSAGFWPGEGCGFAVLMRHADALAQSRRIYAVIRGWGISSDGAGGITRPEVDGQLQALRRAYRRAGYGIDTVEYFEGHGTGTNVGDATELKVISSARREAKPDAAPAAIGSVKANIGHTKAAAGIAGLIKATLAVHTQTLPPTTGCDRPHAELTGPSPALRVLREPEWWPDTRPLRASVSAMGFGGINTHVTLENPASERRRPFTPRDRSVAAAAQDAELFLFSAANLDALISQVGRVLRFAAKVSRSELADLAAELARQFTQPTPAAHRAAVIASTPAELASRLDALKSRLLDGGQPLLDWTGGVFIGHGTSAPRVGFLFPGQGSPAHLSGGLWRRRFESVRELYAAANFPQDSDGVSTDVAQPAVATASLAGLRVLGALGLRASAAVGHSLGEIPALHWAGVLDEAALLRLARGRGRAMADLGSPTGAMAAIAAPADAVQPLIQDTAVQIVGLNSPQQTVVAGAADAVAEVAARARSRGMRAVRLAVSHAFHTPLVAAAAPVLAGELAKEALCAPQRQVFSTVTGAALPAGEDVRALLCRQVTSPVRFIEAIAAASREVDLWIEVGPGQVLTGLVREIDPRARVVPLDCGGESVLGLLQAVAAAFALGVPVQHTALFEGRFTRPFRLDWQPKFFASPCESAPVSDRASTPALPAPVEAGLKSPISDLPSPAATPLDLVRQLVAARAELPAVAVKDDSRMLSDLHLNSISVGQLVAEAARRLNLPPPVGLTDFANATVAKVAQALEQLAQTRAGRTADESHHAPAGVDAWIRPFTVEWIEQALPALNTSAQLPPSGQWKLFMPEDHPLGRSLRAAFAAAPGAGVIVCLPERADESHLKLLLDGAHAALDGGDGGRFVLVHHGARAGGFAKSLHLESPRVTTCVLDVPFDHPQATQWVRAEALAADGFVEACYDASGARREPRLKLLPLGPAASDWPLARGDVLLVTGGGKGITAECALALARETGASLALLGRSQPDDAELKNNLERIAAAGVACRYYSADVSAAAAVRAAVARAQRELGRVTGVLHGAGTNEPRSVRDLDAAAFRRTLAPKIGGIRNVLAAVDAGALKLFVAFGSIIGRAGLPGEADYAVANEWLAHLTEEFQASHPSCRCRAIEWSVWSGLGMGQKLGRIESLRQAGITAITPEEGVAMLLRLVRDPLAACSVVVTGRFGEPPTLLFEKPELPFLRFLERPRVFYPGVELIAESEVSSDSDPYIDDHVYHGERLFPAVMGLEAMAEVAMALAGSTDAPSFENMELTRPVVVPRTGRATIRVAALVREPGVIDVALRSEESGFQVDHFRVTCRFGTNLEQALQGFAASYKFEISDFKSLREPLEPVADLYRDLLFHTGRFERVLNYRLLRAKECVVQVEPDTKSTWFGRYLPQERVLGDTGVRDAAIHAIQACIPHARLLPVGVGRITIGKIPCLLERIAARGVIPELLLHARERKREGDTFHYDLELLGGDGTVLEQWEDLRLRKVADLPRRTPWTSALLGPHVERRVEELIPLSGVSVAFHRGDVSTHEIVSRALGESATVQHRADGKPEVLGGKSVSVARAGLLTLAVAGIGPVGCDLETVQARPAVAWKDLLGADGFSLAETIARDAAEPMDAAATRVWVAAECLKKAGTTAGAPLVLRTVKKDGWVVLASGASSIAILVAAVAEPENRMAVGVLARGPAAQS